MVGYSYQGVTGHDFAVARLTSLGALDGSFSGDGKQTIAFGSSDDVSFGVAVDSQDNVLVAGYSYQNVPTRYDFAVARLTNNGSLDSEFSADGRALTDIGVHGTDDFGYDAVAYQSDGKVIVSGYANQPSTGQDFAVVRYNADGSLDSSFGNGGIVTIDFAFSSDVGRGVTLDSQGRILVSGYSYQGGTTGYDFAVARLSASGALDTSFSGDGKQTINFGSSDDFGWGVAVDSQDNVLVSGHSYQGTTGSDFAVARLTSSAALDGSFSGDGKQTIDFGSLNDYGYGVAVDSQDKVLVAGQSINPYNGASGYDFAVARLTASGAPDGSFDGDGRQVVPFGSGSNPDYGYDVAVDSQDNVLLAGFSYQGGATGYDFAVARLTASSGQLDASFDVDGKRTIDFGSSSDYGYGVAVDSQDKVLVAGTSYQGASGSDFAVARLSASGAL